MNSPLLLLILKASLLLTLALGVGYVLRRASASHRHALWSLAFLALLLLPVLAAVLPTLTLPILAPASVAAESPAGGTRNAAPVADGAVVATTPVGGTLTDEAGAPVIDADAVAIWPSLRTLLLAAWLGGVVVAGLALLVAWARVLRLTSTARIANDDWTALANTIALRLGYRRRVRVLASADVQTPMAGGFLRPTVFVPADAAAWDTERREIVLSHEIAHLVARDPLRKLVSRLACSLYWFHPLAWLAQRQATADCERACDEAVLALGIRPSTYARVLLEFADVAPTRAPALALPIVRRAQIEERLMAILGPAPRASSRRVVVPFAVAATLTLALAAAQPASPATAEPIVAIPEQQPTAPRQETTAGLLRSDSPSAVHSPVSAQPSALRASLPQVEDCWADSDHRDFSGSMSMSGSTIHERIGRRDGDRVIQTSFDGLRVCMITDGYDGRSDARPSQWLGNAERIVMETRVGSDVRQMVIAGGRTSWTRNGQVRPVDDAANQWRAALLAVLDETWDLSQLRGTVSTLRGEISTVRGHESTLRGEISTLRGHVSTLRGEISTIRGHESTLRGEISTIRGHESTLRGMISTERGAISTLQASRWDSGLDREEIARRIRRHEDEIKRIEAEIVRYDADARVRAVEREIAAYDTDARVAEVEKQLREFDVEARVAAVQKEIGGLDVAGRVRAIEDEIASLDAPRRTRELEDRRDAAVARLRSLLR